MREYDEDVWVKHLARRVEAKEDMKSTKGIVVTDARQENEIEWLRNNGFTIVKVDASDETRRKRTEKTGETFSGYNHPTERYVDSLEVDYTLNNDGTLEELYEQIDNLVEGLNGE